MKFNFALLLLFMFLLQCTVSEKITDGYRAMEVNEYVLAIDLLSKSFNESSDGNERGKIAYTIGQAYIKQGNFDKAGEWLLISSDLTKDQNVLMELGNHYKTQGLYEKAFNVYKNVIAQTKDPILYQDAKFQQQASQKAFQWVNNPTGYKVASFSSVNTMYDDFSPVMLNDRLHYVSNRPVEKQNEERWKGYHYTNIFFNDNYVDEFNDQFHDGPMATNISNIIITRCGYESFQDSISNCYLYEFINQNEYLKLPFQNDLHNYRHPATSVTGDTLFFSSDNPLGLGGYDLYMTIRKNGNWMNPTNLGSVINTPKDELFPHFYNNKLYFSSNGLSGMGGLDVFYTSRSSQWWEIPVNLQSPFNSPKDDFGVLFLSDKEGYLSSNRSGGKGGDDIYQWYMNEILKDTIVTAPKSQDYKVSVLLKVFENKYQDDNPDKAITSSELIKQFAIEYHDGKYNSIDEQIMLDVSEKKSFPVLITKDGYFNQKINIDVTTIDESELLKDSLVFVNVYLDKIYTNREISIDNIYYDLNKWDIRNDAKNALETLVNIMILNPNIQIELGSHTDCRGSEVYNQTLSQKRAESVIEYLYNRGVSKERMSAKGYGESAPITYCECNKCSEEEHQKNRRTTFKVVNGK